MSRPRRLAVVLAACSALALAACGADTSENNEYVDEVNQVNAALLESVETIPATGGSPGQVSTALESVSAQLRTAASDLAAVSPPDDVADLHAEIVHDVETLSEEASNAANEVAAGGAAGAAGVVAQFVAEANRIGAEIDATITEINEVLQS